MVIKVSGKGIYNALWFLITTVINGVEGAIVVVLKL